MGTGVVWPMSGRDGVVVQGGTGVSVINSGVVVTCPGVVVIHKGVAVKPNGVAVGGNQGGSDVAVAVVHSGTVVMTCGGRVSTPGMGVGG